MSSIREHELHQDIARFLIDGNALRSLLHDHVSELFDARLSCNRDGVEWCRLDAMITEIIRRVDREKLGVEYIIIEGGEKKPFFLGHVCDGCDRPTQEPAGVCLHCGDKTS